MAGPVGCVNSLGRNHGVWEKPQTAHALNWYHSFGWSNFIMRYHLYGSSDGNTSPGYQVTVSRFQTTKAGRTPMSELERERALPRLSARTPAAAP